MGSTSCKLVGCSLITFGRMITKVVQPLARHLLNSLVERVGCAAGHLSRDGVLIMPHRAVVAFVVALHAAGHCSRQTTQRLWNGDGSILFFWRRWPARLAESFCMGLGWRLCFECGVQLPLALVASLLPGTLHSNVQGLTGPG